MKMQYDVGVSPCADYAPEHLDAALRDAIQSVGGLDFIRAGMTVALKVNLVAGAAPERAVTTHPALVQALCRLLRSKGADVLIGDSPGGVYNASFVGRIYRVSGFEACVGEGVRLNDDFSQSTVNYPQGTEARSFTCTSYLKNADVIINVCKLKTHGMMGMSCAAKNMFGAIPGTMKPEYHFRFPTYPRFADMIVDLNEYFKPVLCLCDAVDGMEGNGPTAGTPRHIGCVLASRSPHALDLIAAYIIGLTPDRVPTLIAAQNRGLIPKNMAELKVKGDPDDFRIADYRNVAVAHSLTFRGNSDRVIKNIFGFVAKRAFSSRPVLRSSLCVGCGMCERICPARAIIIRKGKACIDRKTCIRCFCCQEFCPKGAMRVYRSLVARVLSRARHSSKK